MTIRTPEWIAAQLAALRAISDNDDASTDAAAASAAALFAVGPPPRERPTHLARLVYDSRAAADAGAPNGERRLLFQASLAMIELSVGREPARQMVRVAGVLRKPMLGNPISARVEARRMPDDVSALTDGATNESGEFVLWYDPPEEVHLRITIDVDGVVELPLDLTAADARAAVARHLTRAD